MLSTAVSICGVSAAIAACGAIQGDEKQALLRHLAGADRRGADDDRDAVDRQGTGMDDLVAGAWLGGTLDTCASVVAAGDADQRRGDEDRRDREVLAERADRRRRLCPCDLVVAARRQPRDRRTAERGPVIWERFPKFVLGFVAASAVFSFACQPELVAGTRGALGRDAHLVVRAGVRVASGSRPGSSSSRPTEQGGRRSPSSAAQGINVIWTLVLA